MDPYRTPNIVVASSVPETFSFNKWWRNRKRRLALWFGGSWRYRHRRCYICGKAVIYTGGDNIPVEWMQHLMEHQGEKEARQEFAKMQMLKECQTTIKEVTNFMRHMEYKYPNFHFSSPQETREVMLESCRLLHRTSDLLVRSLEQNKRIKNETH